MERWSEFAAEQPAMAEAGRALLYQFKVGLGYLATVRRDGAPRVHPVCPVIAAGGLYLFIGNQTPKLRDLLRDGRYALHTFPNPEVDDEFTVSGRVERCDDPAVREVVYAAYTATGNDTLFELWLERALHAKYGPRPSWPPVYMRWPAGTA
jgi:Pyridoxamine 5'-phosphate oxidase